MIARRPFGRTGHESSVTLFGAAALARASQADADGALEALLRCGVNRIDTAARYADSELRIGPWMARHRRDFFLATKTGSRSAREARDDLHRSLDRLRVDHVDLIQLHSLGHPDDWEQAMGPGGVLEAVVDARQQGLARFIGVTGHGWTIAAMHKWSLARFDFDAVLLPFNFFMAQDERYRRTFEDVLRICGERNTAVQVIKSIARGPWATTDLTPGERGAPWRSSQAHGDGDCRRGIAAGRNPLRRRSGAGHHLGDRVRYSHRPAWTGPRDRRGFAGVSRELRAGRPVFHGGNGARPRAGQGPAPVAGLSRLDLVAWPGAGGGRPSLLAGHHSHTDPGGHRCEP